MLFTLFHDLVDHAFRFFRYEFISVKLTNYVKPGYYNCRKSQSERQQCGGYQTAVSACTYSVRKIGKGANTTYIKFTADTVVFKLLQGRELNEMKVLES